MSILVQSRIASAPSKEEIINKYETLTEQDNYEECCQNIITCVNCSKQFSPSTYGIDNEYDECDTFVCGECYVSLHFPLLVGKYELLRVKNVECNTKYEFNVLLEKNEFEEDDCILGVLLEGNDLLNVFRVKESKQTFVLNASLNGQGVSHEGRNFFRIDSNSITSIQNILNFECLSFSKNISIDQLLLEGNSLKPSSPPTLFFLLLHCKVLLLFVCYHVIYLFLFWQSMRISKYVEKEYKRKFWSALRHEKQFEIFAEQERQYANKTVFLRIKNFHQIFPYMYRDEDVWKMSDNAIIQFPVESYHHGQPFDLRQFCEVNMTRPDWMCPICNKHKLFLRELQPAFYLFYVIQTEFLHSSSIKNKFQISLANQTYFSLDTLLAKQLHNKLQLQADQANNPSIQPVGSSSTNKEEIGNSEEFRNKKTVLRQSTLAYFLRPIKSRTSDQYDYRDLVRTDKTLSQQEQPKQKDYFTKKSLSQDHKIGPKRSDIYQKQRQKESSDFNDLIHSFRFSKKTADKQSLIDPPQQQSFTSDTLRGLTKKALPSSINGTQSQQQNCHRVYGKIVESFKRKNDILKDVQEQNEMIIEEGIDKNEKLNNDSMKFQAQISQISTSTDLGERVLQHLSDKRVIGSCETSFLRSPLEIRVLLGDHYENNDISLREIAKVSAIGGCKRFMGQIFNMNVLKSHSMIFNYFGQQCLEKEDYPELLNLLRKSKSLTVCFDVLLGSVYDSLYKAGNISPFFHLLSDFGICLAEAQDKFRRLEAESVYAPFRQGDRIHQPSPVAIAEKMIECLLGVMFFREKEPIQQLEIVLLDYINYFHSSNEELSAILQTLQQYIPHKCPRLEAEIQQALQNEIHREQ